MYKNLDKVDFDQVLVINRYCSIERIINEVKEDAEHVVIVSSYYLFSEEKEQLQIGLPWCLITFFGFDNWNHSLKEVNIDRLAFEKSKSWLRFHSLYHSKLKESIIYLKNAFIHTQILKDQRCTNNTIFSVFCSTYDLYNLGVSYKYWKEKRCKVILTGPFSQTFRIRKIVTRAALVKLVSYIALAIYKSFRPCKIYKVLHSNKIFYIYSLKRVKLINGLSYNKVWIVPFFIRIKKGYLAAPIHSRGDVLDLYPIIPRKKVVLINDAFRPSTYPPFFAKAYFGASIIAKNRLDRLYFERAGLKVLSMNYLVDSGLLKSKKKIGDTKNLTVCFSLNHAVDFSSVISRCDTDRLIETAKVMSNRLPKFSFRIRLHPTSDKLLGEGTGWSLRIENYILRSQLSNLKLSNNSLEEDLNDCDVFITEYSQSVIEAISYGKIGMFINLTRRISFAKDLKDVGFTEVYSINELEKELNNISNDESGFFQRQADAVSDFNQKYIL